MTTPRKFVSVATAAEMLELSPRTIRRKISSGEIRAKHVGRPTPGKDSRLSVRIAEEDVLAILYDLPTA